MAAFAGTTMEKHDCEYFIAEFFLHVRKFSLWNMSKDKP